MTKTMEKGDFHSPAAVRLHALGAEMIRFERNANKNMGTCRTRSETAYEGAWDKVSLIFSAKDKNLSEPPRMSIDRQRIAAVKTLEAMGYTLGGDKWFGPDATGGSLEADALHALLVQRADQLEGCIEGSVEEQEYSAIVSAIDAYERKRWPEGKIPGGKG
jgi:hypothetical protein